MYHRLFTIFLILALALTMTACSAAGTARALDAAEDKIETKLDAAENKLEDTLEKAMTPAATASTKPESAKNSQPLTQEDAERIALDHLGFTADQVTRMHTEYEIDDGIPQFDVEFHEGDWEYEFEIQVEDGRILSFDKDHKYD